MARLNLVCLLLTMALATEAFIRPYTEKPVIKQQIEYENSYCNTWLYTMTESLRSLFNVISSAKKICTATKMD